MRCVWCSQKQHTQAGEVESDGGRLLFQSLSNSTTLKTTISPESVMRGEMSAVRWGCLVYRLVVLAVCVCTRLVWYHKHSFVNSRRPEDEMLASNCAALRLCNCQLCALPRGEKREIFPSREGSFILFYVPPGGQN